MKWPKARIRPIGLAIDGFQRKLFRWRSQQKPSWCFLDELIGSKGQNHSNTTLKGKKITTGQASVATVSTCRKTTIRLLPSLATCLIDCSKVRLSIRRIQYTTREQIERHLFFLKRAKRPLHMILFQKEAQQTIQ